MSKLLLVAFAVGANAFASTSFAAGPFDGTWNTVVECENAPDGARGYNWTFVSMIRNGNLVGLKGAYGLPASGRLTGAVRPDGTARLRMNGFTGAEDYSVGRVHPKTAFHFTANGRFEGSQGTASRNELRSCRLQFTRG